MVINKSLASERRREKRKSRGGNREREEMKEKSHFQDNANKKGSHSKISLRTWVDSLSWMQAKVLAREYNLY